MFGKPFSHLVAKTVVAESTTLPDSAYSVARENGVEVVNSANSSVGKGIDQENSSVSRPGGMMRDDFSVN